MLETVQPNQVDTISAEISGLVQTHCTEILGLPMMDISEDLQVAVAEALYETGYMEDAHGLDLVQSPFFKEVLKKAANIWIEKMSDTVFTDDFESTLRYLFLISETMRFTGMPTPSRAGIVAGILLYATGHNAENVDLFKKFEPILSLRLLYSTAIKARPWPITYGELDNFTIKSIREFPKACPRSVLHTYANQAERDKEAEMACFFYKAILHCNPDDEKALIALARHGMADEDMTAIYEGLRSRQTALQVRATVVGDTADELQVRLGEAMHVPEQTDDAAIIALTAEARGLEAQGMFKEAERIFLDKITPLELKYGPHTSRCRGSSLFRLRKKMSTAIGIAHWPVDYRELTPYMRSMLQFCPVSILIQYSMGANAARDHAATLSFNNEIIKVEGHNGETWKVRANVLAALGREAEAVEALRKAIPLKQRANEDASPAELFLDKLLTSQSARVKQPAIVKSQETTPLDASSFGKLLLSMEAMLITWHRDPTREGRSWYRIPDETRDQISTEFEIYGIAVAAHIKGPMKKNTLKPQEIKFLKTLDSVLDHVRSGNLNLDAMQKLRSSAEDMKLMNIRK